MWACPWSLAESWSFPLERFAGDWGSNLRAKFESAANTAKTSDGIMLAAVDSFVKGEHLL